MMNLLTNIYNKLKDSLKNNKKYLRLSSIKKYENTIFCEFNEILSVNGKLIKFNIEEIAKNKNIQESIEPSMLFIIGKIYGNYQTSLKEYRVKLIDVGNSSVILENKDEKIFIKISSLLQDNSLIQQVNQLDLVRLLYPYAHQLGYDVYQSISKCEEDDKLNNPDNTIDQNKTNIVNLF